MHGTTLSAMALLGLAFMPIPAQADTPFAPKSVSIELPDSNRSFPSGPGSEAINNNCLACHSVRMVLNQPPLSKAAWTAEVAKMIKVYKAPIATQDVDTIIDYLVRLSPAK